MIDISLLFQYDAEVKKYKKNDIIFSESNYPTHYYQVLEGRVKMNNYNADGKEFIQNIFIKDMSFGEPPLFIDEPYPANAVVLEDSQVIQVSKANFYRMLENHSEVSIAVNKSLAKRLYYKSIMAPEISSQYPKVRILTLFVYLKKNQCDNQNKEFFINLTRQQIADLTGLRVETVIRTLKQLEKEFKLKIVNSKILF